ncbi:hypothetical protein IQ22_02730 [Pseudomonas duriflava]|uniref:Uncharacterized protein n=1 Tax=Pseudomonas duriflava TaxID=459528 RepID=A0A562Q9S4_9PSED|nr:hypothetical protein IQ22_02730 [Pseudomonas duriflava]
MTMLPGESDKTYPASLVRLWTGREKNRLELYSVLLTFALIDS